MTARAALDGVVAELAALDASLVSAVLSAVSEQQQSAASSLDADLVTLASSLSALEGTSPDLTGLLDALAEYSELARRVSDERAVLELAREVAAEQDRLKHIEGLLDQGQLTDAVNALLSSSENGKKGQGDVWNKLRAWEQHLRATAHQHLVALLALSIQAETGSVTLRTPVSTTPATAEQLPPPDVISLLDRLDGSTKTSERHLRDLATSLLDHLVLPVLRGQALSTSEIANGIIFRTSSAASTGSDVLGQLSTVVLPLLAKHTALSPPSSSSPAARFAAYLAPLVRDAVVDQVLRPKLPVPAGLAAGGGAQGAALPDYEGYGKLLDATSELEQSISALFGAKEADEQVMQDVVEAAGPLRAQEVRERAMGRVRELVWDNGGAGAKTAGDERWQNTVVEFELPVEDEPDPEPERQPVEERGPTPPPPALVAPIKAGEPTSPLPAPMVAQSPPPSASMSLRHSISSSSSFLSDTGDDLEPDDKEEDAWGSWISRAASRLEGKGIIATRARFLAWEQTEEAQEQRKKLRIKELAPPPSEAGKTKEWGRTVLVPIAIPGLGKTFVGLALHHLFGWGHTQSDDIQFKKRGPHLLKNVRELLEADGQRVVYADKNNHVFKLRSDLLKCASTSKKVTRTVALVWQVDKMHKNTLQKLCAERFVGRGERHQTLRAGEGHEDVLWMFFSQLEVFDPLIDPERAFDDVLELDPRWEKEELLAKVLHMLLEKGIISELPTEERVKKAMAHADGHEPEYKKAAAAGFGDAGAKKKRGTPRYYGVAVEVDVEKVVGEMVAGNEAAKEMLSKLVEDRRLVARPHVTIVHNTEVKAERDEANGGAPAEENGEANGEKEPAAPEGPKALLWEECRRLVEAGRAAAEGVGEEDNKTTDASAVTPEGAATTLTLGPRLVFDSRVMSLEISSVGPDLSHLVNKASAHVTIGALSEEVRLVEGKWIFDALRKGEKETRDGGKITVLQVGTEVVKGRLEGLW